MLLALIVGVMLILLAFGIGLHFSRRQDAQEHARACVVDRPLPPAEPEFRPPSESRQTNRSQLQVTIGGMEYDYTSHPIFRAIEPLVARGDWDIARGYLQKIAYGLNAANEQEQREFKHIMMAFAAVDPLYAQCLQAIAPILAENPDGIRQTALYPHMAAAPDAETARYVLYFADELGAIKRQKKGNSYIVFAVTGGPHVAFTTVS